MEQINEKEGGLKQTTQHLTDHISDLLESYYKLGVLNVTDKATVVASYSVTMLAISLLSMFTLLFIGFGVAWWIGEQLQNMLAGFLIMAGVFAILITFIVAFRKKVIFPFIRNLIIKSVYE